MQLAVVVRASQQEKPGAVREAIEKITPVGDRRDKIEIDEHGDRVRGGFIVGWWEQAAKTA